ncbi:alpha/beta hydrolase [Nocardia sp. CDC153]|uniref:alpha/beta hydrolase n=1 Tax=Nocardia sp. CDC153 TaxID=3112167 RepID=UPI002DB7B2E5|nr:alpha/beta hydrolase [Nocardia sp. CDC153]MEC3958704.1 alpha/beta hydrolase [Nocardia sp. CDC153]
MYFTSEKSEHGVLERDFTLGEITGVLWTPESPSPADTSEPAPLILMGHSGGVHKRAPNLVTNARYFVTECGYSVAAIDAPGHGDRPRNAEDTRWTEQLHAARAAGEPMDAIIAEFNLSLAARAVPEWQATLDALQALPEIGPDAPVGFCGITLGTVIGMHLAAVEPRIQAATFGSVFVFDALFEVAKRITIPLTLDIAWHDEEIDRQPSFALFDAFASQDKLLTARPGRHNQMTGSTPGFSAWFLREHLGR